MNFRRPSSQHPVTIPLIFAAALFVVTALVLPVQASGFAQDVSTPTLSAPPSPTPTADYSNLSWLSTPQDPQALASSGNLSFLAGQMIFHGLVDASSCADGGLHNSGFATTCGDSVARNAVILWQNQFDNEIYQSALQYGVPPFALKNVISMESQFWPASHQTIYGYSETGVGHITQMGADSLLRWNPDFYKSFCPTIYSKETCKKSYAFLAPEHQAGLRGAVLNFVNADCGACLGGVDLNRARASIPVVAATLKANNSYILWLLQGYTAGKPEKVFESTDIWRLSLAAYNAGPGCISSAVKNTRIANQKITWKNVSANFDTGCAAAVNYVDNVTQISLADPALLANASTDQSTASQLVLQGLGLFTPTSTPDASTPTIVPATESASQTPTAPEPTATSLTPAETSTEGAATPTETPVPASTEIATGTSIPVASPTVVPGEIPPPAELSTSGEAVVRFFGVVPQFIADAVIQSAGGEVQGQVDALGLTVISAPEGNIQQVIDSLQGSLLVDYVEPNYVVQALYTPNDPGYEGQGYLLDMQVPSAWDLTKGEGIVVAVVDTGVDVAHPELVANIAYNTGELGTDSNGADKSTNGVDDDNDGYVDNWQGWNFVDASPDVSDLQGHGTHTAGIIAAKMDNGIGLAGVAPQALILPLKALDDTGHGTYSQVAEAIIYAVDHGARVINLGFGGAANSEILLAATNYAYDHNVVIVAAAGNSGSNAVFYPAANPHVIAVSAVDPTLNPAAFSTYGNTVTLSAPGVGIYSTLPNNQFGRMDGTSMSAAQVTGVAALLASQTQFDTPDKILNALYTTGLDLGDPGYDIYFGNGFVQAYSALTSVPGVYATPTIDSLLMTPTPGGGEVVDIMAVGLGTAWTNINATAPNNQAATVTSTGTFTAGAGTNRILLVAVIGEINNANQAMTTLTATYGGVPLTLLASTHTTANREHVWVGYLLDSQIPAGAQNVVVTYDTGNATNTLAALDIKVATYTGVNQANPFNGSNAAVSGTTTVATNGAINYVANGLTFYVSGNGGGNATETITANPAITEVQRATGTQTSAAGASATHGAGGTYASGGISITFAGTTSARSALVVGTMNPAPVATAPVLTSPTSPYTSVTDTTATLGATITSQGVSAISARGTCWGITVAPTTNCAPEGGTAIGAFTQTRTGLPAGTLIYYRGYATNSSGTAYSPDGSFYSEPATQASGVGFNSVTLNGMTINWTRGTGTGVIVLMKAGSAITTGIPTDGTYTSYTANTVYGTPGTALGDAYIIYKGTGSNVTVTGLSASTTYYVAVYEYAGVVDNAGFNLGTNYKSNPATGIQATTSLYSPPTLTILSPANGASFQQGNTVGFVGTATIQTDGDISSAIVWKEGANILGTGSSFGFSGFGLGPHVITVSVTDLNSNLTTTTMFTINITALPVAVSPHDKFNGSTEQCAICHRPHAALDSSGALIKSPLSPNEFCLSCHNTDAVVVSTHSNADWVTAGGGNPRFEAQFELQCIQCHSPHGHDTPTSTNLNNIRTNLRLGTTPLPSTDPEATDKFPVTGPVTFTTLTGANSFDDGINASSARLCLACHTNTANAGYPMTRHSGAANHGDGNGNYNQNNFIGKDCTTCHPHSLDSSTTTRDGFSTTCRACHSMTQVRASNPLLPARRQIVATFGQTPAASGDFINRATGGSHHVIGNDAVTDADCLVCHEMTQHKQGTVRVFNEDTGAVLALDYTATYPFVLGANDASNYETFCLSCHDSDGKNGNTTPFSDRKLIPTINTNIWSASQHNVLKTGFNASCLDCHSNGHGSNKTHLQSRFSTATPWDWAYTGAGVAPSDVMDQEENFCFKCHTAGSIGTNVQPAFTSYTNTGTRLFKHNVSGTYTLHDSKEVFSSLLGGANRHIECDDCHEPHKDKTGTSLAPTVKPENTGATGVEPVYGGVGTPSKYDFVNQVTKEYQFCFKCHSSYTTFPTYSPDGCATSATPCTYTIDGLRKLSPSVATLPAGQQPDWRDLARAFNPNNASFHPILTVGKNLTFPNTWTTGATCGGSPCSSTSRVFCTDCHDNATPATGANGPHGSPNLHILKGAVNYITDDNNASITHNAGELCFVCHSYGDYVNGANLPPGTSRFTRHRSNNHNTFPCYDCHNSHGDNANQGLVNFNADHITFTTGTASDGLTHDNSQTAYKRTATGGTCYMSCHGTNHWNGGAGRSYP